MRTEVASLLVLFQRHVVASDVLDCEVIHGRGILPIGCHFGLRVLGYALKDKHIEIRFCSYVMAVLGLFARN